MGRPRKPDPVRHCRNCGERLERKRFNGVLEDLGAFKKRVFCDRECMAKHMEGTTKVVNPRNSRRQAKKARGPFCSECGPTRGQICTHHIDGNPLNNNPSNLKTLCQSCHMKGHWREWKAANPPKQCRHCDRPARHVGLCDTHYTRFRKHGDPLAVMVWQDGKRILVRRP